MPVNYRSKSISSAHIHESFSVVRSWADSVIFHIQDFLYMRRTKCMHKNPDDENRFSLDEIRLWRAYFGSRKNN